MSQITDKIKEIRKLCSKQNVHQLKILIDDKQ